jgi:hypothetical protein
MGIDYEIERIDRGPDPNWQRLGETRIRWRPVDEPSECAPAKASISVAVRRGSASTRF